METIVINGKEHKCSKQVKEEFDFKDIKIKTAVSLAKKIEDEQDELVSEINKRQSKIQDLINQLKDL